MPAGDSYLGAVLDAEVAALVVAFEGLPVAAYRTLFFDGAVS